ncbi:TetR/AcrR family transcriptional regulator [Nonomuraea sp. NPDC049152]|uniref:TetR/AcrR family transcriptional regulator n=1 Tax=Nonomuraea sp. NPDC049152 TaxID=3154350 RepID=UPI0033D47376
MATVSSRRDPDRTEAVLRATLELAQEVGYAKLSIEGIAARAGVGKHTVYRRWPSKGAVVLDVLLASKQQLGYPDTGDIVADLRAQMRAGMELLARPGISALYPALIGEIQNDAALAAAFRERWLKPVTDGTRARLLLARERGQLSPDVDPDMVIALLYGPLYYRILVAPGPYDAAFVDSLLDAAFAGLKPPADSRHVS